MLPLLFPLLGAALGAVGNAVGGALGGAGASDARARQAALLEGILKDYDKLSPPELERLVAQTLGPSAMEGVSADPRLRSEQMSQLQRMSDLSRNGDDPQTKAAMQQILAQIGQQESAGRNSILQNMRARGVSGSGAELAAQLQNQQTSANRAQSSGLQQAADAQRRMLQAISGSSQMAGQLRGQDFSEDSAKAAARDAIARYNAGARTQNNQYNGQLPAQEYAMQLQKLAGKTSAAKGVADNAGASADRSAATGMGVGNAINTAAGGVAGMFGQPGSSSGGQPYTNNSYGYFGYQPDPSTDNSGTPWYLKKPEENP